MSTQAETEAGIRSDAAVTPESLTLALPNLGLGNPSGMIITFAGSTAPTGYLACDGSVDRTTYADLFAVCGTTYGSGDGSTTFNLCLTSVVSSFVVGMMVVVLTPVVYSASGQLSANLQHNHGVTDLGHTHTQTGGSTKDDGGPHVPGSVVSGTQTNISTATTGISIDNDGGSESRPRNIALLYCIKT